MMHSETVNKYMEIITQRSNPDDIFQAKKEYQEHTGDIFEDDKSYEMRMGAFMEWYVLNRIPKGGRLTPLDEFLGDPLNTIEAPERAILESLIHSTHSLFQVMKVKPESVQVLEMFEEQKVSVTEYHGNLHFNKNDLIEGRMYSSNSEYFFTDNFCYHPEPAGKYIKDRLKKLKSDEASVRNQLKQWEKDYKRLDKSWDSVTTKLAKLDDKIANAKNEKKRSNFEAERKKLIEEENQVAKQKSELQKQIAEIRVNEIQIGIPKRRFEFLRKLSYMSLKWERSRKIEIKDIYKD